MSLLVAQFFQFPFPFLFDMLYSELLYLLGKLFKWRIFLFNSVFSLSTGDHDCVLVCVCVQVLTGGTIDTPSCPEGGQPVQL